MKARGKIETRIGHWVSDGLHIEFHFGKIDWQIWPPPYSVVRCIAHVTILLSRNLYLLVRFQSIFSLILSRNFNFVIVLGFVYFLCFEIDVNIYFLQEKAFYFKKAPLFTFSKTEISLITLNGKFALFSVKQNKRKIQKS